jgi:hypothetical protein
MLRIFLIALFASSLMVSSLFAAENDSCDALFVIRANNVSFDDDHMLLKGVDPNITYFCDRPERSAGHLSIEALKEIVSEGENNFAENPPNAALSIFDPDKPVTDIVVVLPSAPKVSGNTLDFEIQLLEGELPTEGGQVALFVDPIGVPLSPTSRAGVHRRHVRRAVHR